MKLLTNRNGELGEQLIGTREQFKEALLPCFKDWHHYAQTHLDLDEYIEQSLDECLDEPTDEELARYEHL